MARTAATIARTSFTVSKPLDDWTETVRASVAIDQEPADIGLPADADLTGAAAGDGAQACSAVTSAECSDDDASVQAEAATDAELTDAVLQLHGLMVATERHFLESIRRIDEAETWRRDGARSLIDWLVESCGVSRSRAGGWVTVARGLTAAPKLEAAYVSGSLSFDQLRPLLGVAEGNEDWFAEHAPGWSVAQCERVGRQLRSVESEEAEERHGERSLRYFWRRGRFNFKGELGDDAGAVVEEALERLAEQAPKNPDTGTWEPYERRCADALTQLASEFLARDQEGDADVATVICHVDPATLAGLDGECELGDGLRIAAQTAIRLMCDCRFQMVKENESGDVIGLGRVTRTVPTWLKRQLDRRDGGCRFPGCPRTAWVDRHHIEFWGQGGPTDPDNLITACRLHHRLIHEGGWRLEGDPNGEIRFISPAGRVHTSRPRPKPPGHPTGSRPPQARPDILRRFGLLADPADPTESPPSGRS